MVPNNRFPQDPIASQDARPVLIPARRTLRTLGAHLLNAFVNLRAQDGADGQSQLSMDKGRNQATLEKQGGQADTAPHIIRNFSNDFSPAVAAPRRPVRPILPPADAPASLFRPQPIRSMAEIMAKLVCNGNHVDFVAVWTILDKELVLFKHPGSGSTLAVNLSECDSAHICAKVREANKKFRTEGNYEQQPANTAT